MTSPSETAPAVLMRACLADAAENAASGSGGPFAALVVKGGIAIAKGANAVTSTNDPTAHAEIQAIRGAGAMLHTFNLAGCELFASCEPCPMCLSAIYWARIDRVYFAATRFDAAAAGFDDARLYDELGLPPSDRSLPVFHLALPEAQGPFVAWGRNPNRVAY
jgi:guanine deaminase